MVGIEVARVVRNGAASGPAMHEERRRALRVAVDGVGDFVDANGYGAGLVGVERRVQPRRACALRRVDGDGRCGTLPRRSRFRTLTRARVRLCSLGATAQDDSWVARQCCTAHDQRCGWLQECQQHEWETHALPGKYGLCSSNMQCELRKSRER